MKALVVSAPGEFGLVEVPLPQPGPYDCLVKIDACAVCSGTDSDIIAGTFPWLSPYPLILGHESTGIVVEVGRKVKHFRMGQRVTRPAAVYAGNKLGKYSSSWGGYAEYGLVRDVDSAKSDGVESSGSCGASRNPLPEGVGAVEGALSINQREILSVVNKIPLDGRSTVLVIGSGYNGLLFALFCKQNGAGRVVLAGNPRWSDRAIQTFEANAFVDYREAQAAEICLAILGGHPSHVIDAVGTFQSLSLARAVMNAESAFGCYGVRDFQATTEVRRQMGLDHPVLDMATDEASFVDEWAKLFQQGIFDRTGMLDGVMPFEQALQSFDILKRRSAIKIVLQI